MTTTAPVTAVRKKKSNAALFNKILVTIRIAVLITCVRHVAGVFQSLEKKDTHWLWSYVPAIAIDGGLLFMAWKLSKEPNNWKLKLGFVYFLTLEAVAQVDGAATAIGYTWVDNDLWWAVKIVLFAFSLPFLLAAMLEVTVEDDEAESTSTELTTASTAPAPAPHQPTVGVENPNRQPRRHRLNRPRQAALSTGTAPTIPINFNRQPASTAPVETHQPPRGNHQLQPSTEPEVDELMVDDWGAVDVAVDDREPSTSTGTVVYRASGEVVEEEYTELEEDAFDAVKRFALNNSLAETARELGLKSGSQAVRKRLRAAWRVRPDWVEEAIPEWVANNQKFLNE